MRLGAFMLLIAPVLSIIYSFLFVSASIPFVGMMVIVYFVPNFRYFKKRWKNMAPGFWLKETS
jgi:hypothetical protein